MAMKRTKVNSVVPTETPTVQSEISPTKVMWINKGGPLYLLNRKRIDVNEKFEAALYEIPKAFRRNVHLVDPTIKIADLEQEAVPPPVKLNYQIKNRLGTQMFDVFDSNGKRINSRNLSENEANRLLQQLMG